MGRRIPPRIMRIPTPRPSRIQTFLKQNEMNYHKITEENFLKFLESFDYSSIENWYFEVFCFNSNELNIEFISEQMFDIHNVTLEFSKRGGSIWSFEVKALLKEM